MWDANSSLQDLVQFAFIEQLGGAEPSETPTSQQLPAVRGNKESGQSVHRALRFRGHSTSTSPTHPWMQTLSGIYLFISELDEMRFVASSNKIHIAVICTQISIPGHAFELEMWSLQNHLSEEEHTWVFLLYSSEP